MTTPLLYFLLTNLFAYASNLMAEPLVTKTLIEIAARHGMPMPPKEARLVLGHCETRINLSTPSTSREPAIYSPAFLLEEKADGSVVILRGMQRRTLEKQHNREPLWRPFSFKHVEPRVGGYAVDFADLPDFVCAVQLAARGDDANAQALWQRFAVSGLWSDGELADEVVGQRKNPALLLAFCIIEHLGSQLLEEPENWRAIHARMKALLEEFPKLKNPKRSDLFNDLTTTIHAKAPATNSTEALLLDWARKPRGTRHPAIFHEGELSEANAPAREIVLRGFKAVSDLLALLDDQRITVHYVSNSLKFPARLGDLANCLLQEIAVGLLLGARGGNRRAVNGKRFSTPMRYSYATRIRFSESGTVQPRSSHTGFPKSCRRSARSSQDMPCHKRSRSPWQGPLRFLGCRKRFA
jgi:hypothetical protein